MNPHCCQQEKKRLMGINGDVANKSYDFFSITTLWLLYLSFVIIVSHSCDHSMSIFILWSFCLSLNNYVNWNFTLILKHYTIHFAILANVVYCHDQYVHMLLFSDVETFLVETLKSVKLNSSAKDHKDRLLEKIRQLLEEISGSSSGQLDSNASSGSLKISGGKGRKLQRPVLIKNFHLLVELFQVCICYCL